MKSHTHQRNQTSFTLFLIIIIIFATVTRTPFTGVGPIISIIREDLNISNVLAGFLTTIPLITFAIVSPFAPKVSKRLGMEHTLFYSVLIIALGMILRSIGNIPLLFFGTVLIGVGIAFGNVLIPSLFKIKYPFRVGILMGFYTVSMNVSAGIGMGLSQPIATTKFGWEGALLAPIILLVITAIFWLPLLKDEKSGLAKDHKSSTKTEFKLLNSPLAWAITLAMGLQSLVFYCSITWIPDILVSQGLTASEAGWMMSLMQYAQIPMTFLIPILAEKFSSQKYIVFLFTALYVAGFAGIYFELTDFVWLWMVCLGLAGGASFGLSLMFFTLRTRTAMEAAQISGFAQSFGYLLAAVGPVLFGYLHDSTGSWDIPNLIFLVTTVVLSIFALFSSQNKYI